MSHLSSKRALVLCGDGINCEEETAYALKLVGIEPTICHINDLMEQPAQLMDYGLLMLPGGFSFGDEVSSGKVLAVKMRYGLGEHLVQFIESGRMVMGICNGFQALVKLGLLPFTSLGTQQVTLTHNQPRRFVDRWVWLSKANNSPLLDGLDRFMLPIRHGEGRLVVAKDMDATALTPLTALQYEQDINGSTQQIAALSNEAGNVFGLMPHPEAFVKTHHHPNWTGQTDNTEPAGLQLFKNLAKLV